MGRASDPHRTRAGRCQFTRRRPAAATRRAGHTARRPEVFLTTSSGSVLPVDRRPRRSLHVDCVAPDAPTSPSPSQRYWSSTDEWHRALTRAGADARRILAVRALRGFADGLVSVLLAGHLLRLGFTPFEVGAIVTGTMLGSAALTLVLGLAGHRYARRSVLLGAAALMLATGVGFASLIAFWPLLVVAVVGTLNPSSGDVSVFMPTEQAALAQTTSGAERTHLFAWYNVAGNFTGALGALATGLPAVLAHGYDVELSLADRSGFVLYAVVAVVTAVVYLRLGPAIEARRTVPSRALARSRRIVIHLAALFSLDSFGGGFVVQSILVLWLYERFHLSVPVVGSIFFA